MQDFEHFENSVVEFAVGLGRLAAMFSIHGEIRQTMPLPMENLGSRRMNLTLSAPPPVVFAPKSFRRGLEVPVFEPYEENLPLQSGFYTFVIDSRGRFRVQWGNTSSHAVMVGRDSAACAGSFRIGRMGRLAEVFCRSYDYRFRFRDRNGKAVTYAIESFVRHPAFDISEHVVFSFTRGIADVFILDSDGNALTEEQRQTKLALMDSEGFRTITYAAFSRRQVATFIKYKPSSPPRLFAMCSDQAITSLEEDGDSYPVSRSEPFPRYSADNPVVPTGKVNFVFDGDGWLILGMKHHHILSGGNHVGGAGHLLISDEGSVEEIQLNFSGHYRPPLTPEYARYIYRALRGHPLLTFNPALEVRGRRFDERSFSSVIRFSPEELEIDDPAIDENLERLLV